MSELWKQCEGQTIDGRFLLERFLASSDSAAIFLTKWGEPEGQKAAIKFVDTNRADASQLAQWRRAEQLSHPHLQKIHQSGRCRLANKEFLYVVEEFADENLGQVLPERALSEDEAREMLGSLLGVISYLHAKGLVHTRIKPANILANGDRLLLCGDTLQVAGGQRNSARSGDAYDAPETANTPLSAAADGWSLGATLVEALTQQALTVAAGDPQIPETLPQPFLDIARRLLQNDPQKRGTMVEVAALLNPKAAAATANVAASPTDVPLSSVPAVPSSKLQVPKAVAAERKAGGYAVKATQTVPRRNTVEVPSYAIPVAVAVLIVLGVIFVPRLLNQNSKASPVVIVRSTETPPKKKTVPETKKAEQIPVAESNSSVQATSQAALESAAEKKLNENSAGETASGNAQPSAVAAAPSPGAAAIPTFQDSAAPTEVPAAVKASTAKGEVLGQVLPEISAKAQATIHGTFFTTVRVQVDAAGAVTDAQFDSQGPSEFFANLAMKAAKKWTFAPPEVGGRNMPSEWVIRFQFSQAGAEAVPRQQ